MFADDLAGSERVAKSGALQCSGQNPRKSTQLWSHATCKM